MYKIKIVMTKSFLSKIIEQNSYTTKSSIYINSPLLKLITLDKQDEKFILNHIVTRKHENTYTHTMYVHINDTHLHTHA